ncbi:MAG: hypothetical protein J07HQW2_00143 [Haloquadratum walsbyi J07HQW2]|jgi:hypothetical protein|uniref:Uncharacterized protein n=1 Tax=Haloquadratum walsbyi J07HQW2 TaxID=1238425 RepID=U1NA56_9EURY|nr:MAG: hypothetical protein J07HQW2_00143 [Haloquadratum walsbyi J07HQW2]
MDLEKTIIIQSGFCFYKLTHSSRIAIVTQCINEPFCINAWFDESILKQRFQNNSQMWTEEVDVRLALSLSDDSTNACQEYGLEPCLEFDVNESRILN